MERQKQDAAHSKDGTANDLSALRNLVKRKDVRTADRAAVRILLRKIDRKQPLTRPEELNAWAYIVRYGAASDGGAR